MAHKVPLVLINSEWLTPAAKATTLLVTKTGRVASVTVPLPNWPAGLAPMPHKVPSALINSEWLPPAAPTTTLLVMVSGRLVLLVVPLPNWPLEL